MEKEHLNKVQTANEVKVSQFHCLKKKKTLTTQIPPEWSLVVTQSI